MALVGNALVGPPVPEEPTGNPVGRFLTKTAGRAKNLWDKIGEDEAATTAAQVFALNLLASGGRDTAQSIGMAGLPAVQAYQQVTQRQKGEAAQAAAAAEEQRRYETEQKYKQEEAAARRKDRMVEGFYKQTTLDLQRDNNRRADERFDKEMSFKERELAAQNARAARAERGEPPSRLEQAIREKWPQLDSMGVLQVEAALADSRRGTNVDTTKIAVDLTKSILAANENVLDPADRITSEDAVQQAIAITGQVVGATRAKQLSMNDIIAQLDAQFNPVPEIPGKGGPGGRAATGTPQAQVVPSETPIEAPTPSPSQPAPGNFTPNPNALERIGSGIAAVPSAIRASGQAHKQLREVAASKRGTKSTLVMPDGTTKTYQVHSSDDSRVIIVDDQGNTSIMTPEQFAQVAEDFN